MDEVNKGKHCYLTAPFIIIRLNRELASEFNDLTSEKTMDEEINGKINYDRYTVDG